MVYSTFGYIRLSLRPYKWYFLVISICLIFQGLHGTIQAFITKIIIDYIAQTPIKQIGYSVLWPAIFFIAEFQIFLLLRRVINYITCITHPCINNDIIKHSFEYTHKHSCSYFNNNLSGAVANNITILAENVIIIQETGMAMISTAVLIISSLIGMYLVHPMFSLGLFIYIICFVSINLLFSEKINKLSNSYAESRSQVLGNIVDSVSNSQSVRLFGGEAYEYSYLKEFLVKLKKAFQNRWWCLMNLWLIQMCFILCLFAFMLYILIQLSTKGLMTPGDFAFILGLTMYMSDSLGHLTNQVEIVNSAFGTCTQSIKSIFIPIEPKDNQNAPELHIDKGTIVFDHVHFSYPGVTSLFEHESIIIEAESKVGLVGYSGSGKSTFINLILRFYDITQGKILIDGQDISNVTKASLYSCIAMIPQEPLLFHRSIYDNIRYGSHNALQSQVIHAAKQASAHEFISQLPEGYNTLVGERGVKLSGGQRQRIAIARAILKNAPILIMDEATSQLDSLTENDIQYHLNNIIKRKTTIIIAHRLSTLLHMDRILVFNQGRIVQDGTHEELLGKEGLYKTLWNSQVGGFLPYKE